MTDPTAGESIDGGVPAAHRLRTSAAHVFVEPEDLDADGQIPLSTDTEHHLSRVLRLRDSEVVSVTDGAGRWRLAVVVGSRAVFALEPSSEVVVATTDRRQLTLAAAIPKGDRLDWMVQKATELGADRIQLLHADRSVVRWKPDRIAKQLDRLQRISDEAARQSRRLFRVEIAAPAQAVDIVATAAVAEPGGRAIRAGDDIIAIGPEGGWSDAELAAAKSRIDLGPNILRTETAALCALALCVAVDHETL